MRPAYNMMSAAAANNSSTTKASRKTSAPQHEQFQHSAQHQQHPGWREQAAAQQAQQQQSRGVYQPSRSQYGRVTPSTVTSSYDVHSSVEQYDDVVLEGFHPDPAPMLAPKSKKMSLGSITYTSDNAREFGVLQKDNSFFLRVEKCEDGFNERLADRVERANGIRMPSGTMDRFQYWPENALYVYCQDQDRALRRDQDSVYRRWHDSRCGMEQLYYRLASLKRGMDQRDAKF